jgi:hypothetical protein
MTSALLNPRAADHLRKLLGMLGSDHDGEVCAAGRAAHSHLRRLGLSWNDIIPDTPDWQALALYCRGHLHELSERERQFIASIATMRHAPSEKQFSWLSDITERLRREVGDAW